MSTVLEKIAEHTKSRYAGIIARKPAEEVKREALSLPAGSFEFEKALKKEGISFICEIKKASPSKGIIAQDFPYLEIAEEYEKAGADAISCLTEPEWFLGRDEYLRQIAEKVTIPVLRKDFTVCDYQIYEAKILGASAVLLICALLDTDDGDEIRSALDAGARIIGVNNRNLHDFSVDVNNSARYRKLIPDNVAFVSESGIKTREDIEILIRNGTSAVLIGETLMRSKDRAAALAELKYGKS